MTMTTTGPTLVTLTCQSCEQPFSIPAWEASRKDYQRKFCTVACANEGKRRITPDATAKFNRLPPPTDPTRLCTPCGAPLQKRQLRSCSEACRAASQKGLKPPAASQPIPVAPKPDPSGLVWAGSNVVTCARCSRQRQRGAICQCERRGEP